MRYAPGHKTATRDRIVSTASRRLRADGVEKAAVAAMMTDAGLTNGAFSAHFTSKNELVAEIMESTLDDQTTAINSVAGDVEAAEAFVRGYLSTEHRDGRADGCPSAALLSEIDRAAPIVRDAYTRAATRLLHGITDQLALINPNGAAERATTLYALLVGTLQLARAMTDPNLSDRILSAGLSQALILLNPGAHQ